MSMPSDVAIVGVACCRREFDNKSIGHVVFEQYLNALAGTGLVPVTIPARGLHVRAGWEDLLIGRLDGLILPGSRSNVAPRQYDGDDIEMLLDEDRDATTLPLIRAAIRTGTPILAICRGFQELNVALGGTLCASVEDLPGSLMHRARSDLPPAERYEPAHELQLVEDGYLHQRLLESGRDPGAIKVNSLHLQGVSRLASSLRAEAYASDGLVESASGRADDHFVLGVQWHPERQRSLQGLDDLILRDFEAACLAHRASRAAQSGARKAELVDH